MTDGDQSVAEQLAAVSADAWNHIALTLTRLTGDRELAEDCVQDAFARALVRWPVDGVPGKPMAWLMTTARNRAMDRAVQAGAVPITSLQYIFELQQDWARSETYEGVMDILRAHSPYGIQVRFSKWALGEHASEAGPAPKR